MVGITIKMAEQEMEILNDYRSPFELGRLYLFLIVAINPRFLSPCESRKIHTQIVFSIHENFWLVNFLFIAGVNKNMNN